MKFLRRVPCVFVLTALSVRLRSTMLHNLMQSLSLVYKFRDHVQFNHNEKF